MLRRNGPTSPSVAGCGPERPTQGPRTILALALTESLRGALSRVAASGTHVVACAGLPSFSRGVSLNTADQVIVELGHGVPVRAAIDEASRAVPPSRILAYCALTPSAMRDAAEAARHGVTRLAIEGHDDVAASLWLPDLEPTPDDVRALLERATRDGAAGAALDALLHALDVAYTRGNVTSLAARAGVHRITLVRQFRRLGLPSPKSTVVRYRLLLAAGLLEHTTRPVAEVCSALGFSSYVAFRRTLARHARVRPASLRARGMFDQLLRALLDPMLAPDHRAAEMLSTQLPTALAAHAHAPTR